jgi:hypothetical protein
VLGIWAVFSQVFIHQLQHGGAHSGNKYGIYNVVCIQAI